MSNWQPIEMAPKDGTRVLLFCPNAPKESRRVAVDWYRQASDAAGFTGWGKFNPIYWPPTHWMLLPEPPTEPRSVEQIIEDVAHAASISFMRIYEMNERSYEISLARHVAVYIARKEAKLGFRRIAQVIGFSDHKGAFHAFNRVSYDIARGDEATRALVLSAGGRIEE